jgi:hypothetical protein
MASPIPIHSVPHALRWLGTFNVDQCDARERALDGGFTGMHVFCFIESILLQLRILVPARHGIFGDREQV